MSTTPTPPQIYPIQNRARLSWGLAFQVERYRVGQGSIQSASEDATGQFCPCLLIVRQF